jgi:hypothetical protein
MIALRDYSINYVAMKKSLIYCLCTNTKYDGVIKTALQVLEHMQAPIPTRQFEYQKALVINAIVLCK